MITAIKGTVTRARNSEIQEWRTPGALAKGDLALGSEGIGEGRKWVVSKGATTPKPISWPMVRTTVGKVMKPEEPFRPDSRKRRREKTPKAGKMLEETKRESGEANTRWKNAPMAQRNRSAGKKPVTGLASEAKEGRIERKRNEEKWK